MRVLIVSWYFPPANTIAAVRMHHMAVQLRGHGVDVRVLTARDIPTGQGLACDVPADSVTASSWLDVPAMSARL